MESLEEIASRIKADYEWCFGCGMRNPIGLHIGRFARHGDTITAVFDPKPDHRGFEGLLHGGILATALDEILAWTAILTAGVMVVTGTLDLKYRKPAPGDGSYMLEGNLDDRSGRRLRLSGRAIHQGSVVAEASGLFLVSHDL